MQNKIHLLVENDVNMRLDKYLSQNEIILENMPSISRAYIQKLIKEDKIIVDNKTVKASHALQGNEEIDIEIPKPVELNIEPEEMNLDIVYEDNDIIVINKPKGMVVHPAPGHYTGTLVNGLLYHCKENLSGINGVLRPGIVHRIDMNTTGIIVVCKNDTAHMSLSKQFKEHSINRVYHAIVHNKFKEENGTIDRPIGRHPIDRKKFAIVQNGKRAVTHYEVLDNLKGNYSYIACKLETGRTHQIRVHMSSISHPLYGDDIYGCTSIERFKCEGQALHAKKLGFIHPTTNEYMEFDSELPEYFKRLIDKL